MRTYMQHAVAQTQNYNKIMVSSSLAPTPPASSLGLQLEGVE